MSRHDDRVTTPALPDAPPRRRIDRGLLIASFVIAGGLVLIVFGFFRAVTGDEGVNRPDAIEALSPVENAVQVLQQERVVVDLEFGYEATLSIDGIELPTTLLGQFGGDVEPGQQIELPQTAIFDPGNGIISFQPTDGALIESFSEGLHEARVVFWKVEDGPANARSYIWQFTVV